MLYSNLLESNYKSDRTRWKLQSMGQSCTLKSISNYSCNKNSFIWELISQHDLADKELLLFLCCNHKKNLALLLACSLPAIKQWVWIHPKLETKFYESQYIHKDQLQVSMILRILAKLLKLRTHTLTNYCHSKVCRILQKYSHWMHYKKGIKR